MQKALTIASQVMGFCVMGALGIIILIHDNQPVTTGLAFQNAQGKMTFVLEGQHPKLFRDLMLTKENAPKKLAELNEQIKTADCAAQIAGLALAQVKKEPLGGKYFWAGLVCNIPEDIDKAEALY
jgi:hypothetical protein